MVSKSKTQFLKNWYYFNTVRIILVEIQSNHKTMPSIVPDHDPNTTYLAHMGVLGYPAQVYRLSTEGTVTRHLIILRQSNQTGSTDFALKVRHHATTSIENTMQCVRLKRHVQNGYLAQIKFSHKTCQIGKTRFQNYFYKNSALFI